MTHECARMFGKKRGDEIHQLVEAATKGPCPCLVGDACPLVQPRGMPTLTLLAPVIAPLIAASGHPSTRRLPMLVLALFEFMPGLWS